VQPVYSDYQSECGETNDVEEVKKSVIRKQGFLRCRLLGFIYPSGCCFPPLKSRATLMITDEQCPFQAATISYYPWSTTQYAVCYSVQTHIDRLVLDVGKNGDEQ